MGQYKLVKEPGIIKALKGAVRQTDAMQAQTDRPAADSGTAYKEAREAPKKMVEGMEKICPTCGQVRK